ncbi:SPOR domain-containing protein [Aurantiacibacter sp. MUD11]|uniref:SPOR domain-containing protein n=1 Tax=Aurantiacibacter sp. MUD11 TaxID=3003265 RepID=UPI0022AA3F78|nr:SPOR domain-containing protein [Aurantiacibacter sp. MUD11]WAT19094.1 SPOR domain-containing protein [Aurantiacibacter sp. MUD11]
MTYPAGDPEDENGEAFEAAEQLALDDGDDDLPWLEDDGYYEDEGGFDARLIWIALIGLLVIAAVLFAGWWLSQESDDPELVADGSTIEAPDGPYKQRPEDPGGREVEGTGDTAYQVAEGESQRGRLADAGEEDPQPSIDRSQGEAATPAAPAGTTYVQIGAFTSRGDANAAWVSASNRYADALARMDYRVLEAQVNGATVYRLQAVAPNQAAGEAACRAIRNAGGDCYIR